MADQNQKAEIFELNNGTVQLLVTNLGCTITSFSVPNKDGVLSDVVLGLDSVESYQKGLAPLFWLHYPQTVSNGGNVGFDKKYESHDGEEGYPGDITVTATYTLTSSTTLRLDMEGVPKNKPTIINLAQHTYWNLAGHNSGHILDHSIKISANHVTPVDQNTVPTGEIMPVKGTPFDFTAERRIGDTINQVGLGYDHNYVLDCGEEKAGLKHAAKVRDPSSSRVLNFHISPSVVVRPGEKYQHSMLFEFSIE
ncbi:unnamed protein product [Vicia faba]|uniref:Aldose 1-epimerase n=1 Tax=Vicia faba TaxID=3906 RepID=A0AAV0ZDQ8_VICFA|nr:unnamed protein product [Vicia faba]